MSVDERLPRDVDWTSAEGREATASRDRISGVVVLAGVTKPPHEGNPSQPGGPKQADNLAAVRICLVSPIGPQHEGNGLAHRARQWSEALRALGDLTTVVVPISGPYYSAADHVCLAPSPPVHNGALPKLATAVPIAAANDLRARLDPFDVVVSFRSYVAPLAVALCSAESRLVIDFDDDDGAFLDSCGDHAEAARFRTLTRWVAPYAHVVVSATASMLKTGALAGHHNRRLLANCVSVPDDLERRPVGSRAVVVGNFGYAPNLEGVSWFMREVVPLVQVACPDFTCDVVGPQSEVISTQGLGFVDDIASVYASADIAVVPVLHGSGSRIKALEAWAHGVPVVGTTVGLDNLGAVDNENAVIRDEPASMAAAIVALMGDPAARRQLGVAGRNHVRDNFSTLTSDGVIGAVIAECSDVDDGAGRVVLAGHLGVTEVDDGMAIFDPMLGMAHHLNSVAAIAATMADGTRTRDSVIDEVERLLSEVEQSREAAQSAVDLLIDRHLLTIRYDGRAAPSAAAFVR
jgi:hypothetical protein